MKLEEELTDQEEFEPEEPRTKPIPRRAKKAGLLLTIFSALVIVLIGGLASYYYYAYQSQGAKSEKALRQVWSETVLGSETIATRFRSVDAFQDLDNPGDRTFEDAVNDTNRDVQDGLFEIEGLTGLSLKASQARQRLHEFLEVYGDYLVELKRVVARAEETEAESELGELTASGAKLQVAYDDLLSTGGGLIKGNFPKAIFDLPADLKAKLQNQVQTEGTRDENAKKAQQAAEQAVAQFVQAWRARNADQMKAVLTSGARSEFNPGILEDSAEVLSFKVLTSVLEGDNSQAVISGNLEKESPDGAKKITETWRFVLLPSGDKWLIDSWKKVD